MLHVSVINLKTLKQSTQEEEEAGPSVEQHLLRQFTAGCPVHSSIFHHGRLSHPISGRFNPYYSIHVPEAEELSPGTNYRSAPREHPESEPAEPPAGL